MSAPTPQHSPRHPANRLARETSPYLLQHAHNPVDWYPWGPEALARSREENRPIFLSIGYSACHWCHVMERESFEDPEVAALMNRYFVNIKVDREERPDIDALYMKAVQIATGQGGWPMSVFLTPDLRPFFAGTYFPPRDRYGMPGFRTLLVSLARYFAEEPATVESQAGTITQRLKAMAAVRSGGAQLGEQTLAEALRLTSQSFDDLYGGFGNAPKFPPSLRISFLLHEYAKRRDPHLLHMATLTLDRMAMGGMYDQVGGGFHRYSVDEQWLVPHFEKMLYDNALLAPVYVEGWQATGNPYYRSIAEQTCDWALREMLQAEGGFASALDADSEGVEGKFYVWERAEVLALLPPEIGPAFCTYYDITEHGNFEEHNIPNLPLGGRTLPDLAREHHTSPEELAADFDQARESLLRTREKRVWPGLDDKVLTSWNGLMIGALARVGGVLGREDYLDAARRAARFVLTTLRSEDGRLLATYRAGKAHLAAYLDDYAYLMDGLIALYQATLEGGWLAEAEQLGAVLLTQFQDPERGGFFFTAADHEQLLVRLHEGFDGATPAGNGLAATSFLRLASLCDNERYLETARGCLDAFSGQIVQYPPQYSSLLWVLEGMLRPPREWVLAPSANLDEFREIYHHLRQVSGATTLLASPWSPDGSPAPALAADKTALDGQITLYECQGGSCQAPIIGAATVREFIERQRNA